MASKLPTDQHVGENLKEQFRLFKIPTDDATRVWRYMRINRFLAMLVTSMAYFRRLDCLEDQFESMYSPAGYDAAVDELERAAFERFGHPEDFDPYEAAYLAMGSAEVMDRASVFVNCWQRNHYESWAMWKQFAIDGVAIRSTIGRVYDSFNPNPARPPVFPGAVEYIDHVRDAMPCPFQWLYKNHMFSWEQEIRLWTPFPPREHSIAGFNDDHPEGLHISVNLDHLIEAVVVLPGSGDRMKEDVNLILEQAGLSGKPVLASAADTIPEYRRYHAINRAALLKRGMEFPVHWNDKEVS